MRHRTITGSLTGLLLSLVTLMACTPAQAAKYTPLPPMLDGSMMPYDFKGCTQPPYLPDSLQAVCALYVARHGSRYLSGPKKMEPVMKALVKGRNSGTLSATGEAFLKLMEQVETASQDNWGDLSPVGIMEEKRLGRRMTEDLKPLLRPGAEISAISSHVPRVVMTMYEFCHSIVRINDLSTTRTDEGTQFNDLLCCFIADSAYAHYRDHGAWREVYDRYVESHVSTEPARRLFTTTDLDDHKLRKLTVDMYEVLKANRAAGMPAPTTRWMSSQEYHACWQADNLRHYLRNTINPLSDLAAHATSPLLRKLIGDADTALQRHSDGHPYTTLYGYFGHCETLLPLLSLLNIPDCPPVDDDFENLDHCWRIQELSPLGANLVILFAEAPSGRYYVTMQLNGRTVKPMIGEPDIVAWSLLRKHWMSLLR